MEWIETASSSFVARHSASDRDAVFRILDQLEDARDRLGKLFPRTPENISVVVHSSETMLYLAHPHLLIAQRLTDPTARRYLAGWFTRTEVHVLSPDLLKYRAASWDSAQALELAPAREYARLVVGYNNRVLPPPFRPSHFMRFLRWAWLHEGAAQHFSGQLPYLRAALSWRLRGKPPSFPPRIKDAALLGGSVFDLLEHHRGRDACVRMCSFLPPGGTHAALERAFRLPFREIESKWRHHLTSLAQA